jgi:hypothetical protein
MKKRDFANLSLSVLSMPAVVASVAGAVALSMPDHAQAQAMGCTGGLTIPIFCSGAQNTGGTIDTYVARQTNFTGSVGVTLQVNDTSAGFGACGAHLQGSGNWFGLTTQGGSMETLVCGLVGAAPNLPTAANLLSGGC